MLPYTSFNNAETLMADKQAPEEETLSVLDVPPGKMGCIIGKRGANILSIKEGCRYIFFLETSYKLTSVPFLMSNTIYTNAYVSLFF